MFTKICSKCKQEKDLSEFYHHKNSKDGLNWYCKQCMKESLAQRKNDEKLIRIRKRACHKFYSNHKDKYIRRNKNNFIDERRCINQRIITIVNMIKELKKYNSNELINKINIKQKELHDKIDELCKKVLEK
jgi:hypothetical protein